MTEMIAEGIDRILADQQQGLRELRARRMEDMRRIDESYAKEIEYILGIEKTKEAISELEADK